MREHPELVGLDRVGHKVGDVGADIPLRRGLSPAMLAVLTMWPSPWRTRIGRNARIPCTTPQRLTPRTHSHAESGPNHGSVRLLTPALLQTTWTDPNRSSAAAARAATAALWLTGVGRPASQRPGRRCFARRATAPARPRRRA